MPSLCNQSFPIAEIFVTTSKAMVNICVHMGFLLLLDYSRVKFLSGESVGLRNGPLGVGWGTTLLSLHAFLTALYTSFI